MPFTLEKIVPWGRSFDEYEAMFSLSEDDLAGNVLGCGDGPASFNCILTARGGHVISVDPLYRFSTDEIGSRINETYEEVLSQTGNNKNEFVWDHIPSVEELGRIRMDAMMVYLSDYSRGRKEGRYVEGSLPDLPFEDGVFDIALCSHLLFLYSEQLSEDFHVESIKELCRVSSETRIFPLMELGARRSRHFKGTAARLRKEGLAVTIEKVPYEFQKGGNEMMRIKRSLKIRDRGPIL